MKTVSFLILISLTSLLIAGTKTVCHPPYNVQTKTVHNGAEITWEFELPDTVISYNNGYPSGIWGPRKNQALGVIFDLSAYPGATLEQIDFAHFSKWVLAGPYLYKIHIYDMDSLKEVLVIDSLTASDALEQPCFEVGVDLGTIPARNTIGIFVEGLSYFVDGSDTLSYPALMSDTSDYVAAVNYYLTDVNDPWLEGDDDYTNFYETNLFSSGATNFIMDLWINFGQGKQRVSSGTMASYFFTVFRGDSIGNMLEIGYVDSDHFLFIDTEAPQNSAYLYAVATIYDQGMSKLVTTQYSHPKIYSIGQARIDANQDFIPDLLNEKLYLKGLVTTPNFDERTDYFIQGNSAGIRLWNYNYTLDLNPGDSVFVQGTIQQVNGMTQIVPDSSAQALVFSSGNALDTLQINIADIAEDYEGMLVEIRNLIIINPEAWPAENMYSSEVQVFDGTDTLNLILDQDTDLDGWTPPVGNFHMIGVVEQYTDEVPACDAYYIRPRYQSDFNDMTSIGDLSDKVPVNFKLQQNYPNPFNPDTRIKYQVARQSNVNLTVYNVLGKKVRTLVNRSQEAGNYLVTFDGTGLASGVYYYQLKTDSGFRDIKKLVLLR